MTHVTSQSRTVLVSGATGFIGHAFVRHCVAQGRPVVALTRHSAPVAETQTGVRWVSAELDRVPPDVLAACGALVHFAATGVASESNNWSSCFDINVARSLSLWRTCAAAGMRRFLICGSCFEYGRAAERYAAIPPDAPLEPVTAYAASKAAATLLALGLAATDGLELTVLRPFHVYGKGEAPHRFWPALGEAARQGRDFPMTSGEQVRDFTPVEFVAKEFFRHLTATPPPPGRPLVCNVGTGQARSLWEFAQAEWQRLGATGRLQRGAIPQRASEVLRYVPEIHQP